MTPPAVSLLFEGLSLSGLLNFRKHTFTLVTAVAAKLITV